MFETLLNLIQYNETVIKGKIAEIYLGGGT